MDSNLLHAVTLFLVGLLLLLTLVFGGDIMQKMYRGRGRGAFMRGGGGGRGGRAGFKQTRPRVRPGSIFDSLNPNKEGRALVEQAIKDTAPGPAQTLADLQPIARYAPDQQLKFTRHVGQLKLQLSEIEFLTHCAATRPKDKARPKLLVYAGSAPGNHFSKIMEMFPPPGYKFLLVDPHEHTIYYDLGAARKTHYEHNADQFVYLDYNPKGQPYPNMPFVPHVINLMDASGKVTRHKKEAGHQRRDFSQADIERMLGAALRGSARTYMFENLFTDDLARAIAAAATAADYIVYFCSDIRTGSSAEGSPDDMSLLWNLALQHSWCLAMRPAATMLKFRVPYYNERQPAKPAEYQLAAFEASKKAPTCPIDFVADYQARRLRYLKYDKIWLQAYPETYSGETRYLITDYDNLSDIDLTDYEDRMFSYNDGARLYKFHDHGCFDAGVGLDACGDCALCVKIYSDYWDAVQRGDLRPPIGSSSFSAIASSSAPAQTRQAWIKEQVRSSMLIIGRRLCQPGQLHGYFLEPLHSFDDAVLLQANQMALALLPLLRPALEVATKAGAQI